ALPRPVRRVEMQADEERLAAARVAVDRVDRAGAEQLGHISDLMNLHVLIPEVMLLTRVAVRVVVDGAAAEAEEMVVSALERPELRQETEVPLADERRAVPGGAQQRRQGRVLGRETYVRVAGERLLEPEAQPILIAAGDQREPRCRAHRGVGVALGQAQ